MNVYLKNKIIVKNVKIIKSSLKQIIGLMFSKQKNIIFEFKKEKKELIHMFFVFYPIDLIFLNKNKKIIELKQNLKPFTIYKSKNKAKYILELKKNTIKNNNIKIDDKISFKKQ